MALPRCGCHSACVAAGVQEGKGEEGEAEARPPPLPETVRCLAGAWARASAATAAAHGAALARALAQALNPGAAQRPGCAAASLFRARTPDEQRRCLEPACPQSFPTSPAPDAVMLQHHGNPSALEAALVRRSCRVGRSARRVCFPSAAHPWAARLAALEAVGGFVQRLQALARQGGAASPASAPAADDAGGAAAVLQGDAVAWVAEVVPGAPGAQLASGRGS